jgi:type I restriction enzyme S subunit
MSDKENLPKGWTIAKFEDLLDYIQPTNYIVKSTEYKDTYKTPVLTAGKSFIKGYTNETDGIFNSLPTIIFDDFTTATQFVNFPFKVKSSAMKILQPTCDLVNIKLAYYLMQIQNIKGETHKRFWISEYSQLPVPLAPLNEQKRIIDKIEELITDLDKGIEYLETTKQQLRVYRQAVLKWAFEGKLTSEWRKVNSVIDSQLILEEIIKDRNEYYSKIKKKPKSLKTFTKDALDEFPSEPFGWQWIKIDSVSEFAPHSIKAGPFGSSLKKESYVSEGYKIFGQEQVIAGDAFLGDYFIDTNKYKSLISCKVKSFDILISLVGTIGKVLILPDNCKEGIINPRLVKISLNRKYYIPKFFKYYFESAFLRTLYKTEAHGATMDVLNLGMIQELPFPLCSIKEQTEVIREIESRLSVCDKIEETIENSLLQAEALRLSIIKKAFEGKLVPQNPSDEPAEKLLERIRAAKGNGKPEKKEKAKAEKGTKIKKSPRAKHATI